MLRSHLSPLFSSPPTRISAFVAFGVLAFAAGCAVEPDVTPTYVEGAAVPAPAGAPEEDTQVVYVQDPPVVNIETYPSVVYEGGPVYFVGGEWYRHDAHGGWAYYRNEPPQLAQQRASHSSDPRWVQASQARRAPEPVAPSAGRVEQAAPPARAEQAAPTRAPERTETTAAAAPEQPKEEDKTAVPARKRPTRAPARHAPSAAGGR